MYGLWGKIARKTKRGTLKNMYKQPYLIQRLEPPRTFINPFSFGGGLKNGGLSSEAMSILKGIFSFDYMGAAEFEWGAMPESLEQLAKKHSDYLGYILTCETKEGKSGEVYLLCNSSDYKEISTWIISKAYNEYNPKLHTKEVVGLQDVINKKSHRKTCGWLDIENHVFFFTDKEMYQNIKKLFDTG